MLLIRKIHEVQWASFECLTYVAKLLAGLLSTQYEVSDSIKTYFVLIKSTLSIYICSTSLGHFYPCTGLILANTAALLSVFWKRALMRPLTSWAVNSCAKGPCGEQCFIIKLRFFLDGNISLKKHRVYLSWQVPFHLPIDPRCLVNLLLKLQSTPYNESSVVQLCICPKLQTKYLAAITLQYMY